MNTTKTEFIYLCSAVILKSSVTTTIIIAGDILHSGTCTVYLFAFLDETDSIVEHLCFL